MTQGFQLWFAWLWSPKLQAELDSALGSVVMGKSNGDRPRLVVVRGEVVGGVRMDVAEADVLVSDGFW